LKIIHLLPELSTNVAQALDAIETHRLQPAIAKHLCHLGVLLPVLLEDQFSLLSLILILSPSPVLTSLS